MASVRVRKARDLSAALTAARVRGTSDTACRLTARRNGGTGGSDGPTDRPWTPRPLAALGSNDRNMAQ